MQGGKSAPRRTYRHGGLSLGTSGPFTSPVSQWPQALFTAGKTNSLRGEETGSAFPRSSNQKFYNTGEVALSRFLETGQTRERG